jgi:hypothetical protein
VVTGADVWAVADNAASNTALNRRDFTAQILGVFDREPQGVCS